MSTTLTPTTPPPYEPHSSPPSYDDVVAKVSQMVGTDATPQKYIDAAATLNENEIDILVSGGDFSDPIKTEEDNKKFCEGAAKALTSHESTEHLRESSNAAVDASNEINRVFVSLHLKIAQIDRIHRSDFEPALIKNQLVIVSFMSSTFLANTDTIKKYLGILTESRVLATEVAIHGNRFDDLIIPFCTDENIPTETRRTILNGFISDMEKARERARETENNFTNLQISFTSFIADFSTWAVEREGQLTEELEHIMKELSELQEKLTSLNISLLALGSGALGLPFVAGLLAGGAAVSGFLAPFLAIAGLIALGVSVAAVVSMAALGIVKAVTETQIREKERQRASLSARIEEIRQAREELVALGEEKLEIFRVNVNVLQSVWNSVAIDAQIIMGHLDGALSLVDFPQHIINSLERANSIYTVMAEYLTNYAKGITS
ncbi:hypothetical protein L228DRAFT_280117 [Xylona heveae TC161]|uniref:Uncharacterized protein n=1 Tax=Xylona heveae (strain CBS 132557 / TC161) TaxID=1328760 RepID=A0A165K4R2_XYLHT|nr:hypothetical protein L228DRAFT_280117 [Xylona heveae TC161]KZF26980.1 hypothetical protein L228DRAFT_280117 [Xylona heveae TC161]